MAPITSGSDMPGVISIGTSESLKPTNSRCCSLRAVIMESAAVAWRALITLHPVIGDVIDLLRSMATKKRLPVGWTYLKDR